MRRECCSFSNGEYVKTGLAELEQWCNDATEEVSIKQPYYTLHLFISISILSPSEICCLQYAGTAWEELKHIRQAVGFLVQFIFIEIEIQLQY